MANRRLLLTLVREITPPVLFRGLRVVARSLLPKKTQWGERGAEWYDDVYQTSDEYRKHYSESVYYFSWTVIIDRLQRLGVTSIIDLGCGPGQFGAFLADKGFTRYCGVDLSPTCIEMAQKKCPSFDFVAADVLKESILEDHDYDCLIALEFLEHVTEELEVLKKVKPGTKFIGTVPNFPWVSHVRHFLTVDEVRERYESLFSSFEVEEMLMTSTGKTLYLMQGVKN